MYTIANSVDARGLNCPLPILRTKKALQGIEADEILELKASDPGSVKDMQSFCSQTGHELLSSSEEQGEYIFYIKKV
ncbi:MAG: sulfurtransferase TusA family protein [Pseudomonadota bacterium]